MFRKTLLTLGASLALTAQPLAAQDEMPDEDAFAALAGMFEVEPLTAEQEARLPLAQEIIARMIPPGSMGEMMDGMMGGMFEQLSQIGMAANSDADFVAEKIGLMGEDLLLTEAEAAELAAMFDPVRKERMQREAQLVPSMAAAMATAMEPTMRKAMSELYAINFAQGELEEINAFFATETGTSFARKSFTMASDPRVMAVSMQALPDMMAQIASMEEKMKAATADLPQARSFDELSDAEKRRVAKLTGYPVENLENWASPSLQVMDAVEEAAEE